MTQQAHNSVRIHAAHGRSEELGAYLANVVATLKTLPGCVSAASARDASDQNLWTVSVCWQSLDAQAAHFAKPAHEGLNGLLSNHFVSSVTFHSNTLDTDTTS
jgi:quinol monooxygenase YgiN